MGNFVIGCGEGGFGAAGWDLYQYTVQFFNHYLRGKSMFSMRLSFETLYDTVFVCFEMNSAIFCKQLLIVVP